MAKKATMTAGKETAKTLTFIHAYTPESNSYVLDPECYILKVSRVLVFMDSSGKISFKRVLMTTCGIPVEESDDTEPLFSTLLANNIVTEDDIFYYRSCFNETCQKDVVAQTIIGELSAWGIDTVKKEDGSMIPLQVYVNETILRKA